MRTKLAYVPELTTFGLHLLTRANVMHKLAIRRKEASRMCHKPDDNHNNWHMHFLRRQPYFSHNFQHMLDLEREKSV